MSTELVKAGINIFIYAAIIAAIGQQILNLGNKSSPQTVLQTQNGTIVDEPMLPEMPGIVIKASDNLRKPVLQLLKKEKYNIKVESYDFQGNEWWYETIIQNGHIIVVYILFGKYQAEADPSKKRQILFMGLGIVLLWFYVLPNFKNDRVKVQVNEQTTYESDKLVSNQLIGAIGDSLDIQDLEKFDPEVADQLHESVKKQSERPLETGQRYNQDDIF